jgi:hypothetical protein
MNTALYEVMLSADHPGYQSVSLRRRLGKDNYEVVMVNVQKLIHYSDQNEKPSFVVSPVEEWAPDKRQGMFEFLAPPGPMEQHVEMPVVSFNEAREEGKEPILGIFGGKPERVLRWVGYTNGRHRTRYLHFAGAQEMPVMCHKDQVAGLQQHCGI